MSKFVLRAAIVAFLMMFFLSNAAYADTISAGESTTITQTQARARSVTLRLRAGQIVIVTVDGGNDLTEKRITAYNRGNVVANAANASSGATPTPGPLRIAVAALRNTSFELVVYTNARVATVSAALATPTANAAPTPIQIGSATRGEIDWSDARTQENQAGDVYAFQGEAGQQIDLRMHSLVLAPVILITGPGDFTARSEADSDIPQDTYRNVRLLATLPAAGEYRIVATYSDQTNLGAYALKLSGDQLPVEQRQIADAQYLEALAANRRIADDARAAQLARIPDLMREGERMLNSGNNERALQIYREVGSIDSDNDAAAINGAIANARLGYAYSSVMTLEFMLQDDPSNQVIRSNLEYVRALQRQQSAQARAQQQADRNAWMSAVTGGFIAGYNAGQAMETERLRQIAAAQAAAQQQAQVQAAAQARALQARQQSAQSNASAETSNGDKTPWCRRNLAWYEAEIAAGRDTDHNRSQVRECRALLGLALPRP